MAQYTSRVSPGVCNNGPQMMADGHTGCVSVSVSMSATVSVSIAVSVSVSISGSMSVSRFVSVYVSLCLYVWCAGKGGAGTHALVVLLVLLHPLHLPLDPPQRICGTGVRQDKSGDTGRWEEGR